MKKLFFEKRGKALMSLISLLLPLGIAAVLIFGLCAGPIWTMIVVPVFIGVWVFLPWPHFMSNRIIATSWISTGLALIAVSHYYAAGSINLFVSLTIFGTIVMSLLLAARKISIAIDEIILFSLSIAFFVLAYVINFGTAYAWPTIIGGFCLLTGLLRTRIRHEISNKFEETAFILAFILGLASIIWQFIGYTTFKFILLGLVVILGLIIIPNWIKSCVRKRQERRAAEQAEVERQKKAEEARLATEAKKEEFLQRLEQKSFSELNWQDVWEAQSYNTRTALEIVRGATSLRLEELLVISNYKKQLVWDRDLNTALEYLKQIARDSFQDEELDKIKLMIENLKKFIAENKAVEEIYEGEANLLGTLSRLLDSLTK